MIASKRKIHGSKLCGMAVTVEMYNTGDPTQQAAVISIIEHVLNDRPGDGRISALGPRPMRPEMMIWSGNKVGKYFRINSASHVGA
jgi:hypothetical protein